MSQVTELFTQLLSFATLLGDVFLVLALVFIIYKPSGAWWARSVEFFGKRGMFFAFLVAASSILGSLFYSDIAGFTPCVLCWWQRVFLYPQAIILGLALCKKDRGIGNYVLLLSGIGGAIALYHTYIQFGGSPLIPCATGGVLISCTQRYFLEFGYVTIPTMALTAYALILIFVAFQKLYLKNNLHS